MNPQEKFISQLEDKKFLATKNNRAENTSLLLKKLEELKTLGEVRVELAGVNLATIKGEKGDKGEQGIQGIPGGQGETGEKGAQGGQGTPGDRGESGEDGKDGLNGENGTDGKDGSPDTAEQIVEKLSTIKQAWLELSQIKGLKELLNETGNNFLNQAKGFAPRSLDSLYDVAVRGSIQNGQSLVYNSATQKWIPGSASVGGQTPLVVTGTVDGNNQIFTTTAQPTVVYVDGIAMQQKDNNGTTQWSYSGGTLTLSSPPPTNAIFAYA